MKKLIYPILLFAVWLSACETEVHPELEEIDPFLVVDGWLTNTANTQQIRLTYIRPYFDNTQATPVTDASVSVSEAETSRIFEFTDDDNNGVYEWIPPAGQRFGVIGRTYGLHVQHAGITYQSFSKMDSVPPIDSVTFEYYPKDSFIKQDYWVGEFWARDLGGPGNTYWIKTWKNGRYLNEPDEINIAYDAGFSAGGEVDSLTFIQPIRTFINEYEQDEDDNFLPPYVPGDSVYIEIHGVSDDAWFFLSRVANETNRPGGFAELFADPLANVPTNIIPSQENVRVVGFFSVASVSSFGTRVNESTIRDDNPD